MLLLTIALKAKNFRLYSVCMRTMRFQETFAVFLKLPIHYIEATISVKGIPAIQSYNTIWPRVRSRALSART